MSVLPDAPYWRAVGVALAAVSLLVWLVGTGPEDQGIDVLYGGVLAVGFVGSLVARFHPRGMARTMVAMALAQASVAAGALAAGVGSSDRAPLKVVALSGGLVVLWGAAAVLFRQAAPGRPPTEPHHPLDSSFTDVSP